MASERERKRIADKVGFFDKLKVSLTPGDVSVKQQQLSEIADRNEADERRKAELEAIRRKRMNAGE